MGLPHPYSYKLARDITNKGYMKRVMVENRIPTTKYIFLDSGEGITDFGLKYPVMVKPADSCAASGVKKARNADELNKYLEEAKHVSRTGRTIIEEFFSGKEVSVYAFVHEGEARILMISERLSTIEGDARVLKCYATITPPAITENAIRSIERITTRIANVFQLENTPLHVQFLCDDDKVSVIEFAPRVGGGLSYKNILENTGFDIISATIDSYLQRPVFPVYHHSDRFFSVNLVYGTPAVFDHMEGVQEFLDNGVIDSIHYHKTPGMKITCDRASGGRIAAILISGSSREEVLAKVKLVFSKIEAYDPQGNKILRKDLYIKQ
jgi:biotin carboxylase